jgi:outer membrane protein insertion porin family
MEFYKIKFKADAYNEVIGKLVLRSTAEMGFLEGYNKRFRSTTFRKILCRRYRFVWW